MQTQTRALNPSTPDEHTPKADRATNSKLRFRPAASLLVLLIATAGAIEAASNAATSLKPHITTLHVSHLTIDHDAATGQVSGFPPRQKVVVNAVSYDADRAGTLDLTKAHLHGLNRIELNFTDTRGYINTGTDALRHANTGLILTRSQVEGTTPQQTRPETIKLTVLPVMFSPPPRPPLRRSKGHPKP